jgi:pimeloyl-ACP methyl ester carboxylesterase
MLHGSPGSLEDFAPQARELAKSFRVTRYDRPGHGFSSMGESTSLAYNAKVAAALLDQLKLERTIVVGHSYGGSSALALALLRSARVSAYVVIDSAVYQHVRPVPPVYRLTSLPLLGLGFLRMIPRERVQANIASKLPAEFLAGPPPAGFVALRAKLWSEPKIAHALAIENVQSGAELITQSERYPQIEAPVYFLSQKDSAPRRENALRFQRAVKQTVLELVPHSGHYIQFERPELVTEIIRRAAREH